MFSVKQTISAFNQASTANQYTMFHVPAIQELLQENERLKQDNERLLNALLKHIENPTATFSQSPSPPQREPCCVFSWNKTIQTPAVLPETSAIIKIELDETTPISKLEKQNDIATDDILNVKEQINAMTEDTFEKIKKQQLYTLNKIEAKITNNIEKDVLFDLSKKTSEMLYSQPQEPSSSPPPTNTKSIKQSAVVIEPVVISKEEEEEEEEEVEIEEEEETEEEEEEVEMEEAELWQPSGTSSLSIIDNACLELTTTTNEPTQNNSAVIVETVVEEEDEEVEIEEEEEEEEPDYVSLVLDGVEYFALENHEMADGTEIYAVHKNEDGDEELGDKVGVLQKGKLVKPSPKKKTVKATK